MSTQTKTQAWQARFDSLRSNKLFETLVISIIVVSALMIGVKTYPLAPLATQVIVVLDWAITFFFLTEISVRFLGESDKKRFFHSGWNVFDTLIVVVSLIPIEDSELALIGRLVRIFRVLRMVSIIPELRTLLNSLLAAMPQLAYVMLMMFIIFYIYAAVGSTFFASINPDLWGDIAISMLTLFRVMTFEDWTDVMYETMTIYPLSWAFYLSFIFLSAFAFLNMIIGIVVNVLEEEHQRQAKEEARAAGEPTLTELRDEIRGLKVLLESRRH
ncbi:ion transporter [Pseudohalioglobus lutimaris]|uniref:Ion transporter n=1 Tax=Pseudohalioglobus lutimaris TaxID=1737061 RepID=A0A2N5WYW2_9GAMM|nr:ion transporter [Pseudohalioglobus lutimaris]PLW67434.1 ion transporter [Pseudohalioglobus lutimaris]